CRRRFCGPTAPEARHLGRALDQVPGVVRHVHLDQHVAGEDFALGDRLRAILHFDHFLHRHEDLAEQVLHFRSLDALDQCTLDALLETRVGVNDEPLFAHPSALPVNNLMIHASKVLTPNKNNAMTTPNANTMPVVWIVSLRVGHDTRSASCHASWAKAKNSLPGA